MRAALDRLQSRILIVLLMLAVSYGTSFAGSISIGSTSAKAGTSVTVPLTIDNNQGSPLGAIQLALAYDASKMSYTSNAPTPLLTSSLYAVNQAAPGTLNIAVIDANGLNAGTMLQLTFNVLPSAAAGNAPISIANTSQQFIVLNAQGITVPTIAVNGAVTITTGTGPGTASVGSDFSGDGKPDLLWRNPASGDVYVWHMNGALWTGNSDFVTNVPAPWKIVGTPDMNGDGKPDLFWRNPATGDVYLWHMSGAAWNGNSDFITNVPAPWEIVGTPDMNGDGKPDLLWRNPTTGDVNVWYMNGAVWTGNSDLVTNVPAPWEIVGTPDMNGDGKPDLLWRNPATGDVYLWYMNGAAWTGTSVAVTNVPAPWDISNR